MPWVVDEERGVAADRLELVTLRHRGAAVERRDDAARETERAGEHPVGPRRPEPRLAVHSLGLAPKEARSAHGVAPDVHQRAAIQGRAHADVVPVVERVAERGADEPQLADRSLVDELFGTLRLRVVAPHERLAQQLAGAVGSVERRLDVADAARQRFLAQHVLAGLERSDRPFAVQRVRKRDVDGLDLRIRQQCVVRAVRARDLPRLRIVVGTGLIAARHRHQLDLGRRVRAGDHLAVDVAGRQDAPLDRVRHRGAHAAGPRSCHASTRIARRVFQRLGLPSRSSMSK